MSETLTRQYPEELTKELRDILGRPCFMCGQLARLLRSDGHEIKERAEDEQAAVIHFLLGHYLRHGEEGWRDAATAEFRRMADAIAAKA